MTDFNSPEQQTQQPTPQEKLQKLWNTPDSWVDGMIVQIEGLPEGMQAIETQNETLVLRSIMPDLPEELNGKPLRDVPIAVFSATSAKPEEILKEAREFTMHALNKEIAFVPPKFKENAA